ncbi:MAG: hypothetical protein HY957_11245 [Nitrospirae bacterium]|nr:hypothetical protein [Nitrospirota bacterium]
MEALKGHHRYEGNRLPVTNAVSAANRISKELKIGHSGNDLVERLPDEITDRFGTDINVIVEALGDVKAEIDKAMVFINL